MQRVDWSRYDILYIYSIAVEHCVRVKLHYIQYFSLASETDTIFVYQVSMFISAGLAVLFFTVIIVLLSCVCFCHRRREKGI